MRNFLLLTLLSIGIHQTKAQDIPLASSDQVVKLLSQKADSGTIVINFWATWCGPCIEEMPYFIQADTSLKGENFTFIFVSFDPSSNSKKVTKFVKNNHIPGTHMIISEYDMNTFVNQVDSAWQGGIPYTIVINKNGRRNHEGAFDDYKQFWHFIRE